MPGFGEIHRSVSRFDHIRGKAIGDRVELKDGSCQGTVTANPTPYFYQILWDDGQSGAVHPSDVRWLPPAKE